jgi:hypothetical protein
MDLTEARKIDAEREAREAREREAAEALLAAQRVEEAKRVHAARVQRLAGDIKEAEGALAAFAAAGAALAKLSAETLARCGADQSGGAYGFPPSSALPPMLDAAKEACDRRLIRVREEHATQAAKKTF